MFAASATARRLALQKTSANSFSSLWHQGYERDGYLIVNNVFSSKEVSALSSEIAAVARGELGDVKGLLPSKKEDTDENITSKVCGDHFFYFILYISNLTLN